MYEKMKPLTKLAKLKPSQWFFIVGGLWLETIFIPPIYHYLINDISPTFTGRLNAFGMDALILNVAFGIGALILIIAGIKGYE